MLYTSSSRFPLAQPIRPTLDIRNQPLRFCRSLCPKLTLGSPFKVSLSRQCCRMAQPWVCTTAAQNTSRMRAATGTRVLCSAAQTIAVKPTKATSEPWAHSSARSAAQEVDHRRSKGRCRKEACRRYQTRGIEHATWAIRPKPLYSLLP